VSILVFVPRDRYTTEVRLNVGTYLASVYEGRLSAWYVTYPGRPAGAGALHHRPRQGRNASSSARGTGSRRCRYGQKLAGQRCASALAAEFAPAQARQLADRYALAFHGGYKEVYNAQSALFDIVQLETLSDTRSTTITFHRPVGTKDNRLALKVYHRGAPIPLSARVPLLENMGFKVINERTYRITPTNAPFSYLHEMTLEAHVGRASISAMLCRAGWKACTWRSGPDGPKMTATTALSDRQSRLARCRHPARTVEISAAGRYPVLRRLHVVDAEQLPGHRRQAGRFVPSALQPATHRKKTVMLGEERLEGEFSAALEDVSSLDDDRILRRFQNVIESILRTNFYQLDQGGQPKATFAFKIESRKIDELPQPRPFREIFVYSPRVEGVHLRFGMVARGGLRWSDRPQDFRTEVLGLVKAQQVKNAVIVPVGAKGGFVPKQLPPRATARPGSRKARRATRSSSTRCSMSPTIWMLDKILPPDRVHPL
jgi:glutamate dehydrogenase